MVLKNYILSLLVVSYLAIKDDYTFWDKIIESRQLHFLFYLLTSIICLIFFILYDGKIFKFQKRKKKVFDINVFLIHLSLSIVVNCLTILLFGPNTVFISSLFGCCSSIYIRNKFINIFDIGSNANKKNDNTSSDSQTEDNKETNSGVNINIVNTNTNTNNNDETLPDYFNPKVTLPDNITSVTQLDIITILEIYGYISPNQKYKMITSSLFESSDEQVKNLLNMVALEESELKEAYAILNIIKLKKKLITKEEALAYILRQEKDKNKNKASSQKGEGESN